MSDDAFAAATAKFEESLKSDVVSPDTNTESKETAPAVEQSAVKDSKEAVSLAIAELDKMDKFKLDGQEWTLKDLKAAIMRQKDYTLKTQEIAKERESLGSEKKFYENLAWDLKALEQDPRLAQKFVEMYPQKFHKYAEQILQRAPSEQSSQVPALQPMPTPDVQLLSRLTTLEKFYHEQEVKKNESAITQTMTDLTKKYPDTDSKLAKEVILARANELYVNAGVPLTLDNWETIFKEVSGEVSGFEKAKYGDLVKKQTEANKQGRDVGAGGGVAGRSPPKFKAFDDIQKYAESLAKG